MRLTCISSKIPVQQACHGCLQMVVTRLQSVQRKSVRDLLVNVVATALHYNAEIAVAALQQQGQLATILSTWFQVIITIRISAPCWEPMALCCSITECASCPPCAK